MRTDAGIRNGELFSKIRTLSNPLRFRIVELTQNEEMSITEISGKLHLSYTKCADYIALLEKQKLVSKRRKGREVLVKSNGFKLS